MAMYEYRCEECGELFTISESISNHQEKRRPKCPECGSKKTSRMFSSFFAKTASKS